MEILVDYDNVLPQMKREGLVQLSSRVVNAIAVRRMSFPERCRLKLYGGWYEDDRLTQQAEDLILKIEENKNAIVVPWRVRENHGNAIAQLEMAYALEIEPQRRLFETLRTRPFSDQVQCNTRRLQQCSDSECPLGIVASFFRGKKCPRERCYTTPGDILRKSEQKLVDTMLTADLVYLGKSGRELVVVSSDDDLWPGIQTALLSGARVLRVHTRPDGRTPVTYSKGLVDYRETTLR